MEYVSVTSFHSFPVIFETIRSGATSTLVIVPLSIFDRVSRILMCLLLTSWFSKNLFHTQQMQESYSHCVPKVCRDNSNNQGVTDANAESECYRRISVVLRTGQQTSFKRDSGEACVDLSPRGRITYQFGHITELEEGCLYTRRELKKMKAFQVKQSLRARVIIILVFAATKKVFRYP